MSRQGSSSSQAATAPMGDAWRPLDPTSAQPAPPSGWAAGAARAICQGWLRLGGWRLAGDWPEGVDKCVLLAAPHTSNWDGLNMLAAAGAYQVKLRWMGKKSLASGPLGWITRWAGIVPIDRSRSQHVVAEMQAAFARADRLVLAIAPEGTRTLNRDWKRGFYHIAVSAGVPIVLSVLDYRRRTISLAGVLTPSGDFSADFVHIRNAYADAGAKFPARFALPDTQAQ
jgi:1-acyl-sn-glycerol-3-phosphate acyltransferase